MSNEASFVAKIIVKNNITIPIEVMELLKLKKGDLVKVKVIKEGF